MRSDENDNNKKKLNKSNPHDVKKIEMLSPPKCLFAHCRSVRSLFSLTVSKSSSSNLFYKFNRLSLFLCAHEKQQKKKTDSFWREKYFTNQWKSSECEVNTKMKEAKTANANKTTWNINREKIIAVKISVNTRVLLCAFTFHIIFEVHARAHALLRICVFVCA